MKVLIGCETSGVFRRALMDGEDGRHVDGFPAYVVTSLGRVISYQTGRPRPLRARPHRGGYRLVTLCHAGRQITVTIHRLVASAFLPNPHHLPIVRHIDGDRTNNAASNLAWGSYADNEADKIGHGTRRYGSGKMKLNREARDEALALAADGVPRGAIAKRFGVDRSTITRLVNGTTWSNRKWPMAKAAAQK